MDSGKISKDNKQELNDIESRFFFNDLKSDYFLKVLFDIIPNNTSLKIIKYNKKIQKRLNISIKDYKEYSELFSSIEIEVTPIKYKYSQFININAEKKESHYHIYFNDDKEEIKRNSLNKDDKVSKIKIIIDYQINSLAYLFYNCNSIKSINFKKFYRNNINNMSNMFNGCYYLREINLNNFNTDNVEDMRDMFNDCKFLKEINLTNFKTNNVTDMRDMFYNCSSLKELNLSNFNTNNVTNMSRMFENCSSLKKLDLSSFNTDNVTNMRYMFNKCLSLKDLNIINFNTKNVTNMTGMFFDCSDELKIKYKKENMSDIMISCYLYKY